MNFLILNLSTSKISFFLSLQSFLIFNPQFLIKLPIEILKKVVPGRLELPTPTLSV